VHKRFLQAMGIAALARLLPLLFGMEHYGDAPVRIELAERWARAPHLWQGILETYQYGPLHLSLIGGVIRLLHDRVLAARLLSLAAGLCCIWLLWRIAAFLRGPEAAFIAAVGLALSPLHIQASTTGASEAPFLALLLAAIDCALLDRALASAILLGAAGLVRYDGWLYVPLLGVLLFLRQRDLWRALGFCALAAAPALLWMWINARSTGDALAPIHYIDREHRALAEMMLAWFGQVRWRSYCLFYWPIAVCGIATPLLGAFSLWGAFRALQKREEGWELVALAWIPAALFTFRAAVLADFRPLSRFVLVAAALSLPFAHAALAAFGRRARIATAVVLVLTPLALTALSWRRDGGLAEWARPLSPISSVPPGIADAATWLQRNARKDDVILLDTVWDYLDIPLAFAVNLPEAQWIRARWTDDFEERLARATPTMAVLIYQGKLGDYTRDRFDFRDLRFCLQARFTYAAIYRRCDLAAMAR
jgi:4-amino-4-deoxy-L-arabinose transferase-like glycosyltransferase